MLPPRSGRCGEFNTGTLPSRTHAIRDSAESVGASCAVPHHLSHISYCTALATDENTLLAFEPTNRIVPMTTTRITANITAYSAMSWAWSSSHAFQRMLIMFHLLSGTRERLARYQEGWGTADKSEWIIERSGWPSPQMHRRLCTPP